ncbi:MAG: hypothetical protein M0R03_22535 [Novosphingobium sp.]|nr:hypothetical protein [Novosphingobium sp.]
MICRPIFTNQMVSYVLESGMDVKRLATLHRVSFRSNGARGVCIRGIVLPLDL